MSRDDGFDPELYEWMVGLPLYDASTCSRLPNERGVYFVVEASEQLRIGRESKRRIVRVGKAESLVQRISGDHYQVLPDLSRRRKIPRAGSVFRLHVGGAWLRKRKRLTDAERWQAKRVAMPGVEEAVSRYLRESVGFHVAEGFYQLENYLIASVAGWSLTPSARWLGMWARNPVIRQSGLWNVQHVSGPVLSTGQRTLLLSA